MANVRLELARKKLTAPGVAFLGMGCFPLFDKDFVRSKNRYVTAMLRNRFIIRCIR